MRRVGAGHVIVLAAGRGVRAGGPKALIRVNGVPWWRTQASRLERTGLAATWVVSDRVRAEMGRVAAGKMRIIVADDAAPMFSSIVAGVESIRQLVTSRAVEAPPAFAFVLPVDVPSPKPEVFDALATELDRIDPEIVAAIPACEGRHGHPVCLRWDFTVRHVLGIASGRDGRLDRLIAGRTCEVTVADSAVLTNLNTAAEFEEWGRRDSGR